MSTQATTPANVPTRVSPSSSHRVAISRRAAVLKAVRLGHMYFGIFITPAILFFAFTGAIQTFSLHETTRGSSYKPPAILVSLGQLHKHQTIIVPVRKPQPETPRAEAGRPDSLELDGAKTGDANLHAANPGPLPTANSGATHSGLPSSSAALSSNPASGATQTAPVKPPAASPPGPTAPAKNLLPMKLFFLLVSLGLLSSTATGLYMSYKFSRNRLALSATLLAGIAIPLLILVLPF